MKKNKKNLIEISKKGFCKFVLLIILGILTYLLGTFLYSPISSKFLEIVFPVAIENTPIWVISVFLVITYGLIFIIGMIIEGCLMFSKKYCEKERARNVVIKEFERNWEITKTEEKLKKLKGKLKH